MMLIWCPDAATGASGRMGKEHLGVPLAYCYELRDRVHGASTNPATQTYAGAGPFSEPETRGLSRFIRSIGDQIDVYLSIHSFGQMLLIPYGNTTEPVGNYYEALNIGRRAMGALSVRYGTEYVTGNTVEVLYAATGASEEWVKEHLGVPLAYCYELRDRGVFGFLLPPSNILPTGEETLDSVIEMLHQAKRFGVLRSSAYYLKGSLLIMLCSILMMFTIKKVRYDNYSLYRILPVTEEHVKVLQDLQTKEDNNLDFWNSPTPLAEYVVVLSSPNEKPKLEELLKQHGIDFTITIPNVQEHIDKETVTDYSRDGRNSMNWYEYQTLDGIYAWLDDLISNHSNVVTAITAGHSYEGRPIRGLKISHGPGRRAVFLEGGIHAREWISPATVNFITNELLKSDDELTNAAARDYDWYLFPVTNPDGYVWSHEQNRMWRKNRRPIGNQFGVDLNRNWNSNWLQHGASTNPATEIYAGSGPFSEPETRSLSRFIRSIGDQIDVYLSVHSFGQMLLIPFGNTSEPLGNYFEALNVGRRAMGALSVRYGTEYVTGNIVEVLYPATGGSEEWVKEQLDVPLAYCYELRDTGFFGFLLPPTMIIPTGEETLDSVIELLHQAKRFGVLRGSGYYLKGSLLMMLSTIFMILVNSNFFMIN
ncbi:hypothetical protein evm_001551 [Chilo suppressalis]|nr:hypothetical protein evm_001551 [Chilo suppressalis]